MHYIMYTRLIVYYRQDQRNLQLIAHLILEKLKHTNIVFFFTTRIDHIKCSLICSCKIMIYSTEVLWQL